MIADSNTTGHGPETVKKATGHGFILLGVLSATFLAYARTLGFGFVHDDFVFLVNNPAVHSWSFFSQYFTASVWEGIYPGVPGNYYRPLFLIWVRLQDALFGGQAGLWHLTTIAMHMVATALAFYLSLRILKDKFAATTAALVFGLHPVHIEAVAWVSGVTEPLMGIFFIGGFLYYLKGREGGNQRQFWRAAALVLFILGLLEKETVILLPLIIIGYECFFAEDSSDGNSRIGWRPRFARVVRAAVPFFLLTIPYLIARIICLKGFSHPATRLSMSEIVFTWPTLVWFWIRHLLVPVGLGTFYDLRIVGHPGLGNFVIPLAGCVLAVGLLVWGCRKSRVIRFAAVWIAVPLLPFFDLRMFNHNNFAQDRFLYLPSFGVAMLAGMGLQKLVSGESRATGFTPARTACISGLAVVLGLGTWLECFYFENNLVFYRYNYLLSPGNSYAANDYGVMLDRLGMKQDALKVLEVAVADDPSYRSAAFNLGRVYYEEGNLDPARTYLERAISIDPSQPNPYFCLGLTELQARQLGKAEEAFRAALRLNPRGAEYHYELGLALEEEGNLSGALAEFQAELACNPTHPYARERARALESQSKASAHQ